MRRKLTAAIFTISTLTAGLAHALGLGEATVRSSLNQPLNAEIELLSVGDLTEREIITALASREDFLRANVERGFFLSDLRFKVEKRADGVTVIRVSSSKAVREPFLNFLVEVNWPTGRLLREYALLIDPPTFDAEARPAAVVAPTASASPVTTSPASATSRRGGSERPATVRGGGDYGPTTRTDTLWGIAMQTRPNASVTPQQMMLALQDVNPDAFIDNNINKLKAGQVLRIPDEPTIQSRTPREAVQQVSAQNRAFADAGKPARRIDARPEAPREDLVAVRPAESRDQLRIVVDSGGTEGEGSITTTGTPTPGQASGAAVVENELALAREELDQSALEKSELKGRVGDLEDQVETLQRLLALKDEQLATLQARLGETDTAEGASVSGTMTAPAVEPTSESAEMPQAPEALSQPGVATEAAEPTETTGASSAPDAAASSVAGAAPAVVEEKPQLKPREVVQVAPQAEPGLMEAIKTNPIYQVALGAGSVALLLVLWLISRASARRESEFLEKQNERNLESVVGAGGLTFADQAEEDREAGSEAVDAIAEADVYIAYQRFDQAAKVLREAVAQNPDNQDLQFKLLEVAAEGRDRELFDDTASRLKATGDDDVIARVAQMREDYAEQLEESGLSLDDLENQLLSGTMPSQPSLARDFEEEAGDLAGVRGAPGRREEEGVDDLDIDFDLGDIEVDDSVSGSRDRTEARAPSSLDDELDAVLAETDQEDQDALFRERAIEETPEAALDELDATLEQGLDDEFDLSRVETTIEDAESELASADDAAALARELEDELSDELRDLDRAVASETPARAPAEEDLSLELDTDDLDFARDERVESVDLDTRLDDLDQQIDQVQARIEDQDLELDLDLDALKAVDAVEAETEGLADLGPDRLDTGLVEEMLPDGTSDIDNAEFADAGPAQDLDAVRDFREAGAAPRGGEARLDGDEFVDDLEEDFDFLAGTDEAATKLDLARAYIDMGDKEGARDILEEVLEEGSEQQQQEARNLLEGLS